MREHYTPARKPAPYALRAYGYTGFPKLWEGYRTLAQARTTAREALADGFHLIEIMKELPGKPSYFGVERELIETIGA